MQTTFFTQCFAVFMIYGNCVVDPVNTKKKLKEKTERNFIVFVYYLTKYHFSHQRNIIFLIQLFFFFLFFKQSKDKEITIKAHMIVVQDKAHLWFGCEAAIIYFVNFFLVRVGTEESPILGKVEFGLFSHNFH